MTSIRPLRSGDRAALEETLRADETFTDAEVGVALELIDDALERGDADYWVRIAEDDAGALEGYVCFGPTPMTDSTWDLYWIVTHPRARGRGVAGRLIEAMERELAERGATAIRVETSQTESYGAARRLYQRLGYPETARLPDFYRAGDDLIVYYKKL